MTTLDIIEENDDPNAKTRFDIKVKKLEDRLAKLDQELQQKIRDRMNREEEYPYSMYG